MLLILTLSGFGAFITSVGMLHGGLSNMALRYVAASVVGYLLFLSLIRLWIAMQRRNQQPDLDPIDALDIGDGLGSGELPAFTGGGGAFGGGGAQGSFGGPSVNSPSSGLLEGSALDLEEAGLIVVALIVLVAGALALIYLVYVSPLLFAEVLLDAAVVGTLYGRARRHERQHWMRGVLRRTALAALVLCCFAGLAGFFLQSISPEATSAGAALRAFGTTTELP